MNANAPQLEREFEEKISVQWLLKIEEVCSAFEALPAEARQIAQHLDGFTGPARQRLIQELIALDRELTVAAGLEIDESKYRRYEHESTADDSSLSGESSKEIELPRSERFEFRQKIGSGGIGHVWRVFDREALRPLAIKTLHDELKDEPLAHERFRREAILTGTLQHPGIPPIYDRGFLEDGTPFFSMKLVEGQTLAQILKSRNTPVATRSNLIQVFASIAQTVAYAHSRGVVHRDLKPHNIMVGRFGEVQVMDWGLAKRLDDSHSQAIEAQQPSADAQPATAKHKRPPSKFTSDSTPFNSELTTSGDVIGTLGYMSPEQARGEVESVGSRSDVFSLGVILFQIICNHRVFESRQRNVLLRQTREGDLSHAMECLESTDASPDLVKLCKECLKSDPDERISDAGVIAMGVSEFLSGFERRLRQAEVDRASAIVRSEESRKRQNWTIGLGALVAVIGLLTLALIADQLRRTKKLAQTERAARTKAEVETQTTGEVNEFLEFILTSGLPKYRGSDVTMLEVIDDFVPELDGKLNERPAVEARIRRTVGESYRWLGELDASEEQLRKAIDAFERANMGKTIEALFTRDRLAGTLRSRDDAGDIKEAIAIRREVVENLRSIIGPDHSETLNVMNNLGITMVLDERASDDQLDEAESIYNEVLERIGQSPELQKELRAGVLVNVASLAVKRANWAKAERIFKEVIEDQGENTYAVLNAGVQLGMMLVERNRPSEAADVLYDAYLGRAKYHGELNHLTLSVFRKFTRALVAAKRFEEAIEATEKSERLHTEDHWFACGNVFEARKLKTESLLGLNRTEDATVFLRETISRYAEHRGEDHAYTREAREQLRRLESEDD